MVGALSCGLCLTCRTGSHTLRRYALARLRDEKVPPCFGLTTCDHHLPVPLRKELCQLLPQRTPVMHGWGRMCGALAKEQRVFPSIIAKHVSAIRPVSSALRALHVNKPTKLGLLRLGVEQLEDLMDLTLEDLAAVGMASKAAARFMHTLWDGGAVRSSIDPGLTRSTPMRDMAALLRMERFKFEFSSLGVRTAADLLALTEQQKQGLKLSRMQTRRINSAIRHLGGSGRVALPATAGFASESAGGATDSAGFTARASSHPDPSAELRTPVSSSAVPPYPERCDCSWSHGRRACRGLWDDFTPCCNMVKSAARLAVQQLAGRAAWDARLRAWAAPRLLEARRNHSEPSGSSWCGRQGVPTSSMSLPLTIQVLGCMLPDAWTALWRLEASGAWTPCAPPSGHLVRHPARQKALRVLNL